MLETFLESDKACGNLGGSRASGLHDSLFIEKGLETQFELETVQPKFLSDERFRTYFGLLLKVECIDSLQLSFLVMGVSMLIWKDPQQRSPYQSKEERCFVGL